MDFSAGVFFRPNYHTPTFVGFRQTSGGTGYRCHRDKEPVPLSHIRSLAFDKYRVEPGTWDKEPVPLSLCHFDKKRPQWISPLGVFFRPNYHTLTFVGFRQTSGGSGYLGQGTCPPVPFSINIGWNPVPLWVRRCMRSIFTSNFPSAGIYVIVMFICLKITTSKRTLWLFFKIFFI
jgi:hypothetical protein